MTMDARRWRRLERALATMADAADAAVRAAEAEVATTEGARETVVRALGTLDAPGSIASAWSRRVRTLSGAIARGEETLLALEATRANRRAKADWAKTRADAADRASIAERHARTLEAAVAQAMLKPADDA